MSSRVLMITAGGTPQVVTETLHHLAIHTAWWPDEVVLMTTQHGDNLARLGDRRERIAPLLGPGGRLSALVTAVGRPAPAFRTVVARHPSGARIDDIRTVNEVNAFADGLLAEVRRVTAVAGELHLSLAGGRKSMSYLAGAVLSLYGRAEDVLSHVLVEPAELEQVPEFWWPGQTDPGSGIDEKGRAWTAATARTHLHEVPFLRARAFMSLEQLFAPGDDSFAGAVARANDALAAEWLTVDTPAMTIGAGRSRVAVGEPLQFAVYRLLAEARKEGWAVDEEREPGALRFADLLFKSDAEGHPLLDRLADIVEDVWLRGKGVDFLRARQQREALVALTPRGRRGETADPRTDVEMIEGRMSPHVSRLRAALREGLPEVIRARAAPRGRGTIVIPWDPRRIEIV